MTTDSHFDAVMDQARNLLAISLDPDTGELADMGKIESCAEGVVKLHLAIYPDAEVNSTEVIKRLRQEYTITQDAYTILKDEGKDHVEWWNEKRTEMDPQPPYWKRYKTYISKKIPAPVVDRLDRLTDRTLGLLEDPDREGEWDRRGLVVGPVQSGKTSNYIGLICKAVDAGYKLVVVLAGFNNNSLRSQTQLRIDEGFLGFDTAMELMPGNKSARTGVGLLPNNIPIESMSLTTNAENGDFKKARAQNWGIPLGQNPAVLVVKKHAGILESLISWATGVKGKKDPEGRYYIYDVPFLLIDDEADNASVNTKKDEVAAINKKIRELLNLFKKSSYVGYTATPFANVFIDPDVDHDELGKDIYPESFIIKIPAPSNYFGALRVFGLRNDLYTNFSEIEPLPLRYDVDRVDLENYFPPKHKKTLRVTGLPQDLIEAVKSFFLTIAARRARGQVQVHNSMLVHVTHYVDVQNQVKDLLQEKVDEMRRLVEYDDEYFIRMIQEKWEGTYTPVTRQMAEEFNLQPLNWSQVRKELPKAVSGVLPVKAINGSAKDVLGFSNQPKGISVIYVGGNKLARGLTLEGLSVSYFTRAARSYDTLMQMGRWFGYRPGYEDLCRLYTTREISMCFEHITLASEELLQQFDLTEETGGSPRDYGNTVRTSPHGMLITAMGKMRSAVKMDLSFSDSLIQLYYYSRLGTDISTNLTHTDSWLMGLSCKPEIRKRSGGVRGHIWKASAEDVIHFLTGYNCQKESWRSDGRLLSKYIRAQKPHGRLEHWIVALLDPVKVDNRYKETIGGLTNVGMFLRSDENKGDSSKPYTLSRANMTSSQDEALGINDEDWKEELDKTRESGGGPRTKKHSRKHLREMRRQDGGTGLLMLYLFDPKGGCVEGELPPVGYVVSFPPLDGDEKISYKVSKDYFQQEFHYEEEDDED